MVLDPSGQVMMQYDKIHLVPFGEYVPWWAFPGKVGKLVSEVGDFLPGTRYRTASTPDGAVGIPICYEDIFPQLVRRLTPKGPGVLVNITDDGWYGDSAARFQHLEMSRFRAIENGRYLLRATNDGVTAVIDPQGRIVQQLPLHGFFLLGAQAALLPLLTPAFLDLQRLGSADFVIRHPSPDGVAMRLQHLADRCATVSLSP